MNAVDTNVLVYSLDDDEPVKQAKAVSLIDNLVRAPARTILLWQVVGELLACLRRWQQEGRITQHDVDANISDVLSTFSLALPTRNVIARSLSLSSRYSLSHWDSMLLSACAEAGVETLYSEDLDDGMTYDTVRVVNPFI